MNGAELLLDTVSGAGIKVCFANPGTTELPLAIAMDSRSDLKPVLCLNEGICTGAADGYGRMLDKPALTLLHLGVGLANGTAHLQNASKARSPVLNFIGDTATWQRNIECGTQMDIESLARTVSLWCKTSLSSETLSQDAAEAIAATGYGGVASLIIPNNLQWTESTNSKIAKPRFSFDPVDNDIIEKAARFLLNQRKTALLLGGKALREPCLKSAARIKAVTGCDLLMDTFPSFIERGVGLPDVTRLPVMTEEAIKLLSQYEAVLMVDCEEPVTSFGIKGFESYLLKDGQKKMLLNNNKQNIEEILDLIAEILKAPPFSKVSSGIVSEVKRPQVPDGELSPLNISLTLAALQPENAVIVDEGVTTSVPYYPLTAALPHCTYLTQAGAAVGWGLPCTVGVAMACPDRPVIDYQADGSALFSIQALWSAARESLNITVLICANKRYGVLKGGLGRMGVTSIGPNLSSLLELNNPEVNWMDVSRGLGVPAASVSNTHELEKELKGALAEPGPHLIEMVVK